MTDTLKPKNGRRRALLISAVALVLVYILWNVPAFDPLLYPLRLFVTYVHEAGHSLAALLTGGQVIGFTVSANGSGLATTAGGARAIIIPAGYLGAALFGSLLFYVVNRFPNHSREVAGFLGIGMVVFTILFARPDETGTPLALMLGVGFGLLLLIMAWKLQRLVNLLVLNILAMMTALNAVLDVFYLTRNIDAARGMVANDAVAFSREITPLIPPSLVAITWAFIAILILGAAFWYGVWKPLRREIDESYNRLRSRST